MSGTGKRNLAAEPEGARPTRRSVLGGGMAAGAAIATLANRPALGRSDGPSITPSVAASRLHRAGDANRSYAHERALLEDHYAHQLAALDREIVLARNKGEEQQLASLAAERRRIAARQQEQREALLAEFQRLPGFIG